MGKAPLSDNYQKIMKLINEERYALYIAEEDHTCGQGDPHLVVFLSTRALADKLKVVLEKAKGEGQVTFGYINIRPRHHTDRPDIGSFILHIGI